LEVNSYSSDKMINYVTWHQLILERTAALVYSSWTILHWNRFPL